MTDSFPSPNIEQHTAQVLPEAEGERLDVWLSQRFDISRSKAQKAVADQRVILLSAEYCPKNYPNTPTNAPITDSGEIIARSRHRVKANQYYRIDLPKEKAEHIAPQAMTLDIVYEDEDIIVINKPVGLVVHPGAGRKDQTLINGLLAHTQAQCSSLSQIGGMTRPGIVHRLDKDTSGLLLIAKNDDSHLRLQRQFQERTIDRCYHALVWGEPQPAVGEIEYRIMRHPRNYQKMTTTRSPKGRYALTRYKTLCHFHDNSRVLATLIECRLTTGRTHQIRVHCLHQKHPLVGDPLYGRQRQAGKSRLKGILVNFSRQALHAKTLGFIHPKNGKSLFFESDLAEDFTDLLAQLHAENTLKQP